MSGRLTHVLLGHRFWFASPSIDCWAERNTLTSSLRTTIKSRSVKPVGWMGGQPVNFALVNDPGSDEVFGRTVCHGQSSKTCATFDPDDVSRSKLGVCLLAEAQHP
jgi:hypothetical protein